MAQPALAIADVVRALEATMTLIPIELRDHPAAVLGRRPAPEAWPATECVAHVICGHFRQVAASIEAGRAAVGERSHPET